MKKLVAFYSRADENYFRGSIRSIEVGNTEKVALMITKLVGAGLFKIEQKVPYSKDYEMCIVEAKKDKESNKRPLLKNMIKSIDEYDEIYLGYPNYWGTMPMAVYTFLESFDFSGKVIHPFCTHEGSGLSSTESDIKRTCKDAIVAKGLSVQGSDVDNSKSMIERWIAI